MRARTERTNAIDALKWSASGLQIAGYGATAMGLAPLNLYCFAAGMTGWLVVSVAWRDSALTLVHSIALVAMAVGFLASGAR